MTLINDSNLIICQGCVHWKFCYPPSKVTFTNQEFDAVVAAHLKNIEKDKIALGNKVLAKKIRDKQIQKEKEERKAKNLL